MRFTPIFSVAWATVVLIGISLVMSLVTKEVSFSAKQWITGISKGSTLGSEIAVTIACLGMVVSTFSFSGLALKFPGIIETLAGGSVPMILVLSAIVALILGCALPTSAVYIMVAITAAPVLYRMGVPLLQAHLFAMYFGVMSYVTPPIAPGAIIACTISGSPFMKTASESSKAAIGGFIVPFLFVMSPVLVLQYQPPFSAAIALVSSVVIIIAIQVAICDCFLTRLSRIERLLFLVIGGILLLSLATGSFLCFAIGIGIFLVLTFYNWQKSKGTDLPP